MERILVIKTSSLGDIIHCFPAVSLLRRLNPDSRIDWLVNKSLADVVALHPGVDGVIHFDRRALSSPLEFLSAFFSLRKRLRAGNYDLAVDFQGLLRNAFFAWCSAAGNVAGFEYPSERISRIFYDNAISVAGSVHAVERNCALACGVFGEERSVPAFEVKRDERAANAVMALLEASGVRQGDSLLIVAPGARWESKKWPSSFFISVLENLRKSCPDIVFVLAGSRDDSAACAEIAASESVGNVVDLSGRTSLPGLFELIRMGRAMLCVDSGPMHIAAALSVPVFAMFGPTDPAMTGPYGGGHMVFQSGSCIKCFRRYCSRTSGNCHEAVDAVAVAEAIKRKLER